jgi:molybdopterin converting factor subunit 1
MSEHARVLFFATLRNITGVKETSIEFPPGANVADVKIILMKQFPALEQYMNSYILALNHEFAADDTIVGDGAEIAMFPPVSGGDTVNEKLPTIVSIVEDEINVNTILLKIISPTTGGVCTFIGTVRGVTKRGKHRQTKSLEYEAYREMAEAKLHQICIEIRARWSEVEGITIIQRIGRLNPGEISVLVACSGSHRNSGIFEATRYGIDRLKEIVPVWKKELSVEGEEWVEGEYHPVKGD